MICTLFDNRSLVVQREQRKSMMTSQVESGKGLASMKELKGGSHIKASRVAPMEMAATF